MTQPDDPKQGDTMSGKGLTMTTPNTATSSAAGEAIDLDKPIEAYRGNGSKARPAHLYRCMTANVSPVVGFYDPFLCAYVMHHLGGDTLMSGGSMLTGWRIRNTPSPQPSPAKADTQTKSGAVLIARHHASNGLFFELWSDSSVKIVKTDGEADGEGGRVVFSERVARDVWASAVHAVCDPDCVTRAELDAFDESTFQRAKADTDHLDKIEADTGKALAPAAEAGKGTLWREGQLFARPEPRDFTDCWKVSGGQVLTRRSEGDTRDLPSSAYPTIESFELAIASGELIPISDPAAVQERPEHYTAQTVPLDWWYRMADIGLPMLHKISTFSHDGVWLGALNDIVDWNELADEYEHSPTPQIESSWTPARPAFDGPDDAKEQK